MKGIDKQATGSNIKRLMRKTNKTTLDLQVAFNLTSPSTIYLWMQGKYVPNAENLVILSQIFNCTIDEILVLENEENE